MVEFCAGCKSSLPKADLTILEGRIFASTDYRCPFCHELAHAPDVIKTVESPTPSERLDVVIARGAVSTATPSPP